MAEEYKAPMTIDELVARPKLTPEEEKIQWAFFQGAAYCMWFIGRHYPDYNSYFNECKNENREPIIGGHIGESMHGTAGEYARGWQFNLMDYYKHPEHQNKWYNEEHRTRWVRREDKKEG